MRRSNLPPSLGILLLFVCKSSEFVQCYYPDGSIPTDYIYVPCTNKAVSSCCIPSEGDICQDSGLCYYPPYGSLFRGACTDQSWASSNCPQVCITGYENTWTLSLPCNGGTFACGGHNETAATCAAGTVANYLIQTTETASSTPTEASTTAATISPSPTETNTIPPSSQSSNTKAALSPGAIAGIAVGPTVALLVGLLILYVVWRNHKKKQQETGQTLPGYPAANVSRHPNMESPLPAYPNSPMKQNDQAQAAEIDGRPVVEI